MTDDRARWREDDSRTYRDLAAYAVPGRQRQIAIVTRLVAAARADGPALDLCCGEGLLTGATETGTRISADMWDEETRRRTIERDGTLDGYAAFEKADWNYFRQPPDDFDKPSTLAEQLEWLREAGFADVDVHWMIAGHAIISGWRR